jgi:2,4-dienoyl-CoA reductase-like NADH-dependent reductase (Old Yellow Enzyme family)
MMTASDPRTTTVTGGADGAPYPTLRSPFTIRNMRLKNRIFMSGHMTMMVTNNTVNADQVAYYAARAEGGAGLIVTEATAVHQTALRGGRVLSALSDKYIAGFARIVETCAPHGCRTLGQLFHPGREIRRASDGSRPVTYSASAVANDRYHTVPREMSAELVRDVIESYGTAARRFVAAGMDGAEIVASHGYLPAQFFDASVNHRNDAFGGSLTNRARFIREVIRSVRRGVGDGVAGMRISLPTTGHEGIHEDDLHQLLAMIEADGGLDYLSLVGGTSANAGGAMEIVPALTFPAGYLAPQAGRLRTATRLPLMLTGRINEPQQAEKILAAGQADLCGMTRALICDPDMPQKVKLGRGDDVRACIACNQACIGHEEQGYPVSCIQYPETGRERAYRTLRPARAARAVTVVGAGPAGMKAAVVAAQRRHNVTVLESAHRVGGQAILAEQLPGRAEFGGLITNLEREMQLAGVQVQLGVTATRELLLDQHPDLVILATGADPAAAHELPGGSAMPTLSAVEALTSSTLDGDRVVIADVRCDWVGVGVAELLARRGHQVSLAITGALPAEAVQSYVRDHALGVLSKLKVSLRPHLHLYGADDDTVYFQQLITGQPVMIEQVGALVLAYPPVSRTELSASLRDAPFEVVEIGDCLSPRTAEEAVLEGLKAAAVA